MSESKSMPLIGDKFPELEVQTTFGPMKLPEAFAGKWFMLFSHPADFTPVCTTEFYAFAKNAPRFKEINTELIGLSIDGVHSHIKWAEWIEENLKQEIVFPIIADVLGNVSKSLGMIHPSKGNNTVRAVFIVDDKGVIRLIMYYPQEVGRNVEEILRSIKALQTASKHGLAAPHNWPENELVKDHMIVPPAGSVKQAKENKAKYENYDWWFCHKAL